MISVQAIRSSGVFANPESHKPLKSLNLIFGRALSDLEIELEIGEDGSPKPMVIVGKNGSGKSNFLSFITDALVEIAAKKFVDAAPPNPSGQFGHRWHRIIGGTTFRIGSIYELALLRFQDGPESQVYLSKGGTISKADVEARLGPFPGVDWREDENKKSVTGPDKSLERIFRDGCYVSFPSGRGEDAYWTLGSSSSDTVVYHENIQNVLRKPISLTSTLHDFRPWLVDVLLDAAIDPTALLRLLNRPGNEPIEVAALLAPAMRNALSVQNVNVLLREVLGAPNAQIVRTGRHAGSRKLIVADAERSILPGLNAFSSGQSMLVGIFGTILRYADDRRGPKPMHEMEGIVVVDEIDAHLHADMQHDVLPRLMKLFPRIQFIVTAHAPLLPLGMEKVYGSEGFSLLEFPHGTQITAERYSEFHSSFEYMKITKAFDDIVINRSAEIRRPLVICEGQTDPKYLTTAAKLLGFEELDLNVDFDWIGVLAKGQARDGGDGQLRQARKTLQNNPSIMRANIVLLFDCDQSEPEIDDGLLHVRVMPHNPNNERCDVGVENLLSPSVFEERFFVVTTSKNGANEVRRTELNKVKLCQYLCAEKRDSLDFEGFRPTLEKIRACLFPVEQFVGGQGE